MYGYFIILIIPVIELLSIRVKGQCPEGYERPSMPFTADSTMCYKVTCNGQKGERWVDAERKCKADGGRLATLENEGEAKWILELASNKNGQCNKYYVNAHASLYNSEPAWFGGDLIKIGSGNAITSIIRSDPQKLCTDMLISFSKECFYMNSNRDLVDIECSQQTANVGFICKRSNTISDNDKPFKETGSPLDAGLWEKPKYQLIPTPSCYIFVTGGSKITSWFAQQN